jgi:hypothetical protein
MLKLSGSIGSDNGQGGQKMDLCPTAMHRLAAIIGSPFVKQTHKVTVSARAKCPGCGREFDVEFKIDQEVSGAAREMNVAPLTGLDSLCMWKK